MVKKTEAESLLDTALGAYPDEYLSCRDTGHSWKPATAVRRPDKNIERVLACVRCEARRTQLLDPRGYVLGSSYVYNKGYQFTGVGRLTTDGRARLRLTNILRNLD